MQIWKTQQWPQDWKWSVLIPIPKKGNAKEGLNYCTIARISHATKVMLKILQARLQRDGNGAEKRVGASGSAAVCEGRKGGNGGSPLFQRIAGAKHSCRLE